MSTRPESSKSPFKTWYEKNKLSYNARRAQRYKEDTEFRNRAIEQSATYRATLSGRVPRLVDGLYTVTHVAKTLNVSSMTIRNWEVDGIIPKPTSEDRRRLYTHRQLQLLKVFVNLRAKADEFDDKQMYLNYLTQKLFDQWEETNESSVSAGSVVGN